MNELAIAERPALERFTCDACQGSGRHAHLPGRDCSVCAGSGVLDPRRDEDTP